MVYWDDKSLEYKYEMIQVFEKQIDDLKEIEKTTKHINDEMDEYAEEFYDDKKDKEKDDGFEL